MSFMIPPIDELDLPKELIDAANRASLSTSSILLTPLPKLADLLKVKIPIAQSYVRQVSHAIAPSTKRLDEVYDEEQGQGQGQNAIAGPSRIPLNQHQSGDPKGKGKAKWVSTGDSTLDQALGGGIRRGCIYEISGESAAGKSHLALHLALTFQLPSLTPSPGGSLILTSERELSTDRLIQLGQHLLSTHEPSLNERQGESRVKGLLDNILTNRVGDVDALEHALNYAVPAILESRLSAYLQQQQNNHHVNTDNTTRSYDFPANEQHNQVLPIRLIILDSITALFRGGSNTDDKPSTMNSISLTERSKHLCIIADTLKSLAVKYDLTILVINQVSDVFSRLPTPTVYSQPSSSFTQTQSFTGSQHHQYTIGSNGNLVEGEIPMIYKTQSRWFSGENETLKKEASLGIVWANAINVRIMLSRTARRRLMNQVDLKPHKRPRRSKENHDSNIPKSSSGEAKEEGVKEEEQIIPTLIRKFHVVFSPFSQACTVDYVITSSGIHSLEDSYKRIDPTEVVMKRRVKEEKEKEKLRDEDNDGSNIYTTSITNGGQDGEEENDGEEEGRKEDWDEIFDDFGELPEEFWKGQYGIGEGLLNMPENHQYSNNINNDNNGGISDQGSIINSESNEAYKSDVGYNSVEGDGASLVGVGVDQASFVNSNLDF